jgi:hypothetical protein
MLDRAIELLRRYLGVVGLEDSGVGLDHLAQRPVRDAVAVRQ